jgi:Cna protein B-type domain protein
MFKNKFKKLTGLFLAAVMTLVAMPIQTLASDWGVGDNVYAAMLGNYIGSDGKTYADKYNYDYIYYKSDGSVGVATRYASTHAKLGVSKNGVTQQAICIEAGVSYSTGSSYVGKASSDDYMLMLPTKAQRDLKIELISGFNSQVTKSPVANTNLDDFSFATQIISWEIQQGLRTGYGKSDLAVNSKIPNTPKTAYYDQLKGRPAEKCYEYILNKMKAYSIVPSFTVTDKAKAPTHTMEYNSSTKKYSITLPDSNKSNMPASAFNIPGVTVTKSGYDYTFSTTSKISGTKACTYKANRTTGKQLVVWKSSGGDSQTMADGIDDPVRFYANFKTSNLGTAQIKKVWEHNHDASSTKADNSDIYFTIKNSSGTTIKATGKAGSYTYSTSGSVTKFKLNSSNTFLVKSLPAGTYTVYEYGTDGAGIPCYTRSNLSKTVTVTAGGTGTVTFKNTRNTGTGKVIKTWVDTNGNAIEASNCISNNQQIYFRIKNADNKYITVSGSKYSGSYTFTGTSTTATSLYVNPGTGDFTVSDLPTGKYTVYEYGSPEGYSVNKASQTITISKDKTSSVSYVNSEDSGTAQIKKVWLSDTTLTATQIANLEKNVYFTVKDANGKYIKVTGSAGAYVYAGTQTSANNMKLRGSKFNVSKLPLGTYSVTEINNASGYNPKTQTKTVTIANKGETKSVSFTNKSTPVVVIRKHFSDEDNLTEAQLKEQYAKVTVNLQVLGYSGSVSSNPPAGYYVEFTGSNGNYTYKGLSSTKTSATNLKLNENGEMTISFGANTTPYYLSVIETYSGTDYDVDNRDQRIDLGDGDPNAVIDLEDIELDNQLKTGSVQIDKQFLNENGAIENIPDDKLAEVAFKIKHNGKYLTFTGSNGIYTYKGENNTGTELKLNKATYNFIANELPAREEYTVYEVSGTTGYSFSIDPVTFTITPAGSVKKVFTNKAMTGTISIVKHSADGVLSGWQFRVTGTAKTGQSYDKTFITDANGNITISNLRIGDYKVTEVKTGKTVGYITEESKDIEVKTDTVTTVNIENKPYANIVINKVDAKTGEKVTGATFGIYTDAECEIPAQAYTSATDDTLTDAVITESATGKYTCNFLPIESKDGTTYYVKELIAPEGYYLDTNVHAVTLQTANATVSVNNEIGKSDFNEYPYGHGAVIKEWKLDNGTADMTADEIAQMKAELEKSLYFTVKDRNGKYITATGADGIYTYNGDSTSEFRYTLKNSTFAIAELPTGDYTVTEFSTLSDYTIKSENPVKITVARNQTATATFVNERDTGTGKVIKVWKQFDTMTAAEQAEIEKNVYFTVTDSNGAYLKVKESNGSYIYCGTQKTETKFALKNGEFVIAELPTGKYTITEINNAEGYLPKTQVKTITVTKDATASAEFVNKVIVGNVTLTKVDEDYPENKLTGAVFTVYKSDKKTVVGTMKETETGVYSLEGLVYGEYYVQETKAPEYFVRDVNFYYFQIVNDGETVEVSNDELGKGTFINSPQKGEIKIVKTSYNNKVEGFKFEVSGTTYTGQTFKKTYTTDKDGIIRITDLRAGEYTIHEVKDSASAGYLLPEDKQLTIDRDGAMLVAKMHNDKIPDNPPTGAGEDGFMQTAVIIISTVMMSAAVVLAFPLSKRKRKR